MPFEKLNKIQPSDLQVGNLYEINAKDGFCYFYKSCLNPHTIVKINNKNCVLYLGEKFQSRNNPFCEQFIYEFLFENSKLYLVKLSDLSVVSV